jgi:hypothetical protein
MPHSTRTTLVTGSTPKPGDAGAAPDGRNGLAGKRLLLKNPVNTARMGLLFEMFPSAKCIHIHRDPYDVFRSTGLYARLGCEQFGQVRPRIDTYLDGLRGYQKNRFSPLTPLEISRIDARWGFAFSALGYGMRTSGGA